MHAAIDANKNGGIPLGGWTSFENDTAPNDEWLQAGTTFDPDTYPEMYLYLGGNKVPERYDHSRLGDIESIVIKTVGGSVTPPLAERTIIPNDGVLFMKCTGGASTHQAIIINDSVKFLVRDETNSWGYNICTFPVKKGDVVYSQTDNGSNEFYIRYYTHPMFIKATTTASSYTPSTAVQEIKDYTKDYVDAKNSYSTEETLTGGTWYDGKPIYRKVFTATSFTNSFMCEIPNIQEVVNLRPIRQYDNRANMWVLGAGVTSTNNLYYSYESNGVAIRTVSSSTTIYSFTVVVEYTKTTD